MPHPQLQLVSPLHPLASTSANNWSGSDNNKYPVEFYFYVPLTSSCADCWAAAPSSVAAVMSAVVLSPAGAVVSLLADSLTDLLLA